MNKYITFRKWPTSREENDGIYRFVWETCRESFFAFLDKLTREFGTFSNREPSLFAVAKLLATGLVNLNRVEVLWSPVTNHLLEVIVHPLNRLREWGIDVITTLVRSVIQYDYYTPLKENQRLQTLLISPLNELSSTSFADVNQKQVDCVLHLLHSSGDIISFGWPLFLNIIGAINNSQG
ncbi:protein MON2 homolog isoform X1 [Daphnia magna]|uniref:protein MON2 homolog isoform X1 n=1 Tax=Daphnia magna TaxID=35525 RepID=UPI001E1BD1AF|nr:protein MON2 homolog isoform X1 [Daphnia magna]